MFSIAHKKLDLKAIGVAGFRHQFFCLLRIKGVALLNRFWQLMKRSVEPLHIYHGRRNRLDRTLVVGPGEFLEIDCFLHGLLHPDVRVKRLLSIEEDDLFGPP